MKFASKTRWSDLFRKNLLLTAFVLPGLAFAPSVFAQATDEEVKVEVASVDAAVSAPVEAETDVAAQPAEPTIAAEEAEPVLAVVSPEETAKKEAREKIANAFARKGKDKLDGVDRKGIAAFYDDNGYASVWIKDGKLTSEAKSLIAELGKAGKNGLKPSDYSPPARDFAADTNTSDEEIFDVELQMSLAAVRYARHLASGRLVPQSVSASLDMHPERPDAKAVLADLSVADNAVAELNDYHPKHPAYHALLKQLAELEKAEAVEPILIEAGKLLRPGMSDPRVKKLRERLDVALPVLATADDAEVKIDEDVYDAELVQAVKDFQKENRLSRDGIVGPSTIRALNGGSNVDRKTQIIVNLERWRWMPKELGKFHIFANIPEYRVYVKDDGKVHHTTRVVVGKAKHKTVMFSDEMEHFVVNPSWGVPQSIIKNEMLPSARSNPGYFSRKGYQVFARIRGRTRRIDPNRVNWRRVSASQISVRQPPGARNALGRIKFLFPNKHAIYMHDTPSKSLFKRDQRAFSHGCVRIHNPMEFADAILKYQADWNAKRIKRLVGGKEVTVNFDNHIPVHIGYFTAVLEQDGTVGYRGDIYGHDRKMASILGL